jgi:dTDP-4-dehydrorhamnose reductase
MKILITGASGFVGSQTGIHLQSDHELLGLTNTSSQRLPFPSRAIDLCRLDQLDSVLEDYQPEVILHLAALSQVVPCEDNPVLATLTNTVSTSYIAEWAARHSTRLIFASTDQVFDGHRGWYRETDIPSPTNHYGRTKYEAERTILSASNNHLIIRSNSIVGPSAGWGSSFSDRLLVSLRNAKPVFLFHDQFRSPIHIRSMVEVFAAAIMNGLTGVLHAGGLERQSRLETGIQFAAAFGFDLSLIHSISYRDHERAGIMHGDGSFDITYLTQTLPDVHLRPLVEEFRIDAQHSLESN